MKYLNIILIFCLLIGLFLSFINLSSKMTAMETVADMGIGYNLANTFECYNPSQKINTPEEQITLWGNKMPTKDMFKKLKKYGFKTIRLPITWINFIDDKGKVKSEWLSTIKNVVDLIVIDNNMYCILNIHHDGKDNNWLSKGINSKNIYINLWKQIAEEFINYDEHLLFESMDNPNYYINGHYDFDTLFILNQIFVNTIRNTGGNNKDRLLLISGGNSQIELVCSDNYKMPIDPSNKMAITISYFVPSQFCVEKNELYSKKTWGTENDYKDMFTDFITLKNAFIDKGIPVIIVGVSVVTVNKEKQSIRDYIFFEFSLTKSLNYMMSCLWDTSTFEINYYDRDNDKWLDEEIKKNFKLISKGKYINPLDYSYISNIDTVNSITSDDTMKIKIGKRRVLRAIYNVKITNTNSWSVGFGITGFDSDGNWISITVSGGNGKKEYDGTYTYNIDISYKDYNDYVEIHKWWGNEYVIFNYFSLEFEQNYIFLDFNLYKNAFLS